MTEAICPYCRTSIELHDANEHVCTGCGTPHHTDCYTENGGCTVFGCSAAPAEEAKLRLGPTDLANFSSTPASAPNSPMLGLTPSSPATGAPPVRVKAPPPPMPPGAMAPSPPIPVPRFGSASVLFGVQPVAAVAVASPSADILFEADNPESKNRMTFIVLGVLLGPFGAHNFYAGYRGKAIAQLCITVLSLGFAAPMSWVWAVVDVWTVDRDSKGIKFRS